MVSTEGNRDESRGGLRHLTNREKIKQIEFSFDAFIGPFLDEEDPEDFNLSWEFKKFVHSKKLKVLTAEREGVKKWKEQLLSR